MSAANADRKVKVISGTPKAGDFQNQEAVPLVANTDGIVYVQDRKNRILSLSGADSTLGADLASGDAGKGASLVAIQDAAANFSSGTVEAALAEILSLLADQTGSNGDRLLGVKRTLAGAVALTLHNYIEGQPLDVYRDFGADKTGSASALSAFQAAIDATANSGVQRIHVPRGTYLGDMTTLSYGSRRLVWDEEPDVTYSTAAPSLSSATRLNVYRSGDGNRPYFYGNVGFWTNSGQTNAGDFALVRVDRTADYTGTASGVTHALRVNTDVSSGVGTSGTRKPEWAITAQISNASDNCNAVALTGQAIRETAVSAPVWGGQFVGKCLSESPTSFYTRGFEADINAEGADGNNRRVIADFIGHNIPASGYDGTDEIYCGIRIEAGTALIKNAIVIDESPGVVTNGIVISNTGTSGIVDNGVHAGRAVDIKGSGTIGIDVSVGTWSTHAIRLGSDQTMDLSGTGSAALKYDSGSSRVWLQNAGNERFGFSLAATPGMYMNATQVLTTRRTGWTDQTATASRANIGGAPTLSTVASFCRALYDDLKSHGLIGN